MHRSIYGPVDAVSARCCPAWKREEKLLTDMYHREVGRKRGRLPHLTGVREIRARYRTLPLEINDAFYTVSKGPTMRSVLLLLFQRSPARSRSHFAAAKHSVHTIRSINILDGFLIFSPCLILRLLSFLFCTLIWITWTIWIIPWIFYLVYAIAIFPY